MGVPKAPSCPWQGCLLRETSSPSICRCPEPGLGGTVLLSDFHCLLTPACVAELKVALGKLDKVSVMKEGCPSEIAMVLEAGSLS